MISDDGIVKNRKGRIIKPRLTPTRGSYYWYVDLYNKGRKSYLVHRLVAMNFIPNPLNKPSVDHINRDINDNRSCNLRWATWVEQQENTKRRALC